MSNLIAPVVFSSGLPLADASGLAEALLRANPGVLIVGAVMTFLSIGAIATAASAAFIKSRQYQARTQAVVELARQGFSPAEIDAMLKRGDDELMAGLPKAESP